MLTALNKISQKENFRTIYIMKCMGKNVSISISKGSSGLACPGAGTEKAELVPSRDYICLSKSEEMENG